MATVPPSVADHVKVDGLPLDTHGWRTLDRADLYNMASGSGSGVDVAYHLGVQARRRWPSPKRVALGLMVFGDVDSDGNAYADTREGLRKNLEELKTVLRPRLFSRGTQLLTHVLADGSTRTGQCHTNAELATRAVGPDAMRAVVDLLIPEGVLRSTQATAASGSSSSGAAFDLTVGNPGTVTQLDTVITLTGTATSVLIESSGLSGVRLDVQVDLNNGEVTVDTGAFTTQQGGNDMHGNVTSAGHERWLPIEPGGDTWTITPTGGDVTVDVTHYAPWS